ncbi:MAG: Chorismate pyruvate-lyase [Candidatus Argoarchaeum ethanivorans]|uniref:Chorismate pyruvate-lyase n=1 Tax=Candidatus Argoarchaeum ethanivorans TaxID=2608793 RepID=A0A811TFA2_9EURY|nr:MAG: Chorismate pyruvate-lyase [Candidatus Argoarchaeum ethanivorans]
MIPDVPTSLPLLLRICAVTDGSITYLLEAIFGGKAEVSTLCQQIVEADENMCSLLNVSPGEPVNIRKVTLEVNGVMHVFAKSLSPVNRMPVGMREQLMQADIPVGKILRSNKLETRRDILHIERLHSSNCFTGEVLSRDYVIIHDGRVLMWINEVFPIDYRWGA